MDATRDPIGDLVENIRGDRSWIHAAVLVVAFVHAGVGTWIGRWRPRASASRHETPTEMVEVDIPMPSPAPTPPPQEVPPAPEKMPAPPAAPKAATPPPAPAQAAAVLTKTPDPNEPVDLTGDALVVGSASTYAGGETSSNGTNARAVRGVAGAGASPAGRPPTPAAPSTSGPDRSRRPSVLGDAEWKCPFPPEADADQVDSAVVTIRVAVGAAGTVERVDVVTDPGHGFGREARRCATTKRWNPALDRSGTPMEGTVTLRVRFDR